MAQALSKSARRVQQALDQHGLELTVVELDASTRSAQEAAIAVGCQLGQIVKSLVFRGSDSGRPILVVASGANRVDEARLATLLGEPVQRPDAAYVREVTGFAIGGVAPLGHKTSLSTYIDQDLLGYDVVWAAAGTPRAVFRLRSADLQMLTAGRVARICG